MAYPHYIDVSIRTFQSNKTIYHSLGIGCSVLSGVLLYLRSCGIDNAEVRCTVVKLSVVCLGVCVGWVTLLGWFHLGGVTYQGHSLGNLFCLKRLRELHK